MKRILKKMGVDKLWRYLNTTFLETFLRSTEDIYQLSSKWSFLKSLELVHKMRWGKKSDISSFYLPNYENLIYARRNNSDFSIFKQIFLYEEYDRNLGIKPGFIIDAGAHCGMASIYFANMYPQSKIVAVEPSSENYSILLLNIEGYQQVRSINCAVWGKKSQLQMINSGADYESFQYSSRIGDGDNKETPVDAVTIENLINTFELKGSGVLKLDVEGAEKNILQNNTDWYKHFPVIFIEPHERYAPGCLDAITEFADKRGYSISHRGENLILQN